MQLVVFNGSPRRKASNSRILLDAFFEGFTSVSKDPWEVHYLMDTKRNPAHLEAINRTDHILVIFPLYTDAMPGIVHSFFESLVRSSAASGKTLGFIVQSGFPESKHSIFVARYLEKLAKRLDARYLGTVIRGGVEGIQIQPPAMTRPLLGRFRKLGAYFAQNSEWDPQIVRKLARPDRFNRYRRAMFHFFNCIGLINFYWNKKLREHQAYDRRFDRPYEPAQEKIAKTL